MSTYDEPTSQLGSGFASLLQSFDDYGRQLRAAQGKRFVEVRCPDGELHACLIQELSDPFEASRELAGEVELLQELIGKAHSRHNALPLINGIAHNLLGQRGYPFISRLVDEGFLAAEEVEQIRHDLWYDPEHPAASPTLTAIQAAAERLLAVLLHYAEARGIEVIPPRPRRAPSSGFRLGVCPLVRLLGLGRLCGGAA